MLSPWKQCKRCCAKSLQSCPTLCDPMDCSSSGSSVHGILQARVLEWVAISFSKKMFGSVHFSYVCLCATLWTVVHQAPLSMGFSRQEYWGGLLCPSPRNIPDPGIEPVFLLTSPALAGESLPLSHRGCPVALTKHLLSRWWIKVRDQREKEVIRER